jgi:type IV fimbrial biogenesis protein FimT
MRKRCCAKTANRRGFTLTEVTVTIAVIAVIAAMAAPRFGGSIERQRADGAVTRLVADLAAAQQYARRTSSSLRIEFDATKAEVRFPAMPDPDHPKLAYTIALAAEPYLATLEASGFKTADELTFDGFGDPDSGGTITLRVGAETRSIAIDADTGRAYQP